MLVVTILSELTHELSLACGYMLQALRAALGEIVPTIKTEDVSSFHYAWCIVKQ